MGSTSINPFAVFRLDGAPTPNGMGEIDNHAENVAGVMISTHPTLTGVAPQARLYASGTIAGGEPDQKNATSARKFINLDVQMRAINLSLGTNLTGSDILDGNAFMTQYVVSSGEYEPENIFGVPVVGWDYSQTSGVDDVKKYAFDEPLRAGSYVSITLAFDRAVFLDDDSHGIIGEWDPGDTFEQYSATSPHADDVINDLDLYLLPKGATDFDQAISVSDSSDSTIDHIFFQIPTTGEYEFWVHQFDQDFFGPGQSYAVAWWADAAAGVATGDYNGDQVVDSQDYAAWRNNFGGSVTPGTGADGNNNGVIDSGDYIIWRKALNAGSGSSLASVPEPSTLGIEFIAIVLCWRTKKAGSSPAC
jgi:hypothetical protein